MSKRLFTKFFNSIIWLTGIIVSLAVAFGMIDGVLSIRGIPQIILVIFGWVVVATTLISIIIGIFKTFSKN